jgi:cell division protein ZapB
MLHKKQPPLNKIAFNSRFEEAKSSVEVKSRSHYSAPLMSSNPQPFDWESDIEQLEQRINDLASLCNSLREENRGIRIRLQEATAERDQLREKNQFAVQSVESMLESVRVLERES